MKCHTASDCAIDSHDGSLPQRPLRLQCLSSRRIFRGRRWANSGVSGAAKAGNGRCTVATALRHRGTRMGRLGRREVTAEHHLRYASQDIPRLRRRPTEMRTLFCGARAGRGNRRQVLLRSRGHALALDRRACVSSSKDWKVNPIEVIPKPICPNDGGDVSRGKIESEEGIGDFLREHIRHRRAHQEMEGPARSEQHIDRLAG